MTRVRCAIYTRKSTEEGLEQDFNSLDAQFEACAAYIKSQASEGWLLTKERYDDGGVSGGTLARPALERLIKDIRQRRIDIVVIYKVDRLTRSLLDFSKLVEIFDRAGASFVSITQSFNTTTSMGRLTLNMLLSFAQFEREVTAERIRDKISASKARGMWMGGTPPIGYRPEKRSLVIVEPHAAVVRDIFDRFLRLGSVRLLYNELLTIGIGKPRRTTEAGREYGGTPFNRSELYTLLKNRMFVGDMVHKDKAWPGLHPAIIDRDVFERAQELIADSPKGGPNRRDAEQQSMLAGRVVDDRGQPLIATHTSKNTSAGRRRYRYYVSKDLQHGTGAGMRIPALDLEHLVVTRVVELLSNPLAVLHDHGGLDASSAERAIMQGPALAAQLRSVQIQRQYPIVRQLIAGVAIQSDSVVVRICWSTLAGFLEIPVHPTDDKDLQIEVPGRLPRSGRPVRMIQQDGRLTQPSVDLKLVKLIVKARTWWQRLQEERGLTVTRLAASENVTQSYVTRILRLAFLSPEVIHAIMIGKHPAWLDSGALSHSGAIALDWELQKETLLLGRPA